MARRDRKVRRRGAIDDRRNDAGRQEGEGSEEADVPFAQGLTLGMLFALAKMLRKLGRGG